jgi:DNA-directed RNA polymerase II subunit RPB1
MSGFRHTHDSSVIKGIEAIEFGIWGNDEIAAGSCMSGTHGIDKYEPYNRQEPTIGGVLDSRMGASSGGKCASCGFDEKHCDGHFSHIELADAIFNIGFLGPLKNVLECICLGCGHLLLQKDNKKLKGILEIKSNKNRLAKVHELASKVKVCSVCGVQVSKIKIDPNKQTSSIECYSEIDVIEGEDKRKQRLYLSTDIIAEILDSVPEEDCAIIGIDPKKSKLSDMIHKTFPVAPMTIRPSVKAHSKEDGLTMQLGAIVRANIRMQKNKSDLNENVMKYSKDNHNFLQLQVTRFFDEDFISHPKSDNKGVNFIPLYKRHKGGKDTRMRGNLMGKRSNFNARTVITADPTVGSNEISIPKKIAMNVTVEVVVTPENIDELTELVRNGSDKYPGANFVFPTDQYNDEPPKPIFLKLRKEQVNLKYGYIVERHIRKGDPVFLNRQPSLHKHSMMAFKARIIDDPNFLTFGVNLSVTKGFNADFDGRSMVKKE